MGGETNTVSVLGFCAFGGGLNGFPYRYDVEEDGVLEFVLKRRRPGWRPVVIGRAQRKVFELISFTSGYRTSFFMHIHVLIISKLTFPYEDVLAIYDEEHRCIGNIEVSVTCSHINRISVVYSQLDARLDLNPHADHEEEEKLQEGHSKREEESPDQPTGVGETLEATKTSIEGLQAIAEEAGIGNLPDKVKTILEKLEPLIKVVGAIDALVQVRNQTFSKVAILTRPFLSSKWTRLFELYGTYAQHCSR